MYVKRPGVGGCFNQTITLNIEDFQLDAYLKATPAQEKQLIFNGIPADPNKNKQLHLPSLKQTRPLENFRWLEDIYIYIFFFPIEIVPL